MRSSIIKIGNSRRLQLSKTILKENDIKEKVELMLKEDRIIIVPHHHPRKGWDTAFRKMHRKNDDALIMDDVFPDETFE